MNLTKILATTWIATIALMSACSDSDPRPKELPSRGQFSFNTTDLKSTRFYLVWEGKENGHRIRHYTITDGKYSNRELNDETFMLSVYLGVPEDSTFKTGNFPVYKTLSNAPDNERLGAIVWWANNISEYAIPDGIIKGNPIVVTGGTEIGNTMTILFTGTLTRTYMENGQQKKEDVIGSFAFQGKVQDTK